MYKSPIEIIYGQMQTQMEGDIFRAVQSYFPNVDKEELLRALQYDRDQYHKGYADGRRDAMDELVLCKDCKHRGEYECPMYYEKEIEWDDDGYTEVDYVPQDSTMDDGFCDRGERGTDNE